VQPTKDEYPAPSNAEFAFADFLIEGMQQLHARLQRLQAGREEEIREPATFMDPVIISLMALAPADSKASIAEACEKVWREGIEALTELCSWEQLSIQLYEQIHPHLTSPIQFLPRIKSTADILSYKCKESKNCRLQWSRYLAKEKSLFSTSTGNFGVASLATRIDDEIWIMAGSKFPAILRHMRNGHYEFVGEAYVRGFMNGEALFWEDGPAFVDVILE